MFSCLEYVLVRDPVPGSPREDIHFRGVSFIIPSPCSAYYRFILVSKGDGLGNMYYYY